MTCDGLCPIPGEICQAFVNGNPTGKTTINSLNYPSGGLMICDCAGDDVGACCFDSDGDGFTDTCKVMNETCCDTQGGIFGGAGSSCSSTVGACCLDEGSTCVQANLTCCESQEGSAQRQGSTCLGDLNGNGVDDVCEGGFPTVSQWGGHGGRFC